MSTRSAKLRPPAGPRRGFLQRAAGLLWRAATLVERRAGVVPTLLLGLCCAGAGILFSLTLAGMPIGLPLLTAGVFLMLRGLY